ncbi:tyrosine-type recombinase/integrase [Bradyrhizobium sp. HKCCYLS1011]|uniref:tyrosine-type recombinase/integrase n=1 Tax=Bradyrhizobium sp. HKCCYLS1011 TaxID=3420733 RepID=UPI003EBBD0A8
MARISQGLNPAELQSLPDGEHCDGGGLYLRVTGMGGRSWIVKYQWAKKQEKMGIGSLADVGLAAARKKAREIRNQARDGINPKLMREQVSASARSAPSFKEFAATILEQKIIEGLKGDKSKAKAWRCINVYCASLHKLPIDQIGVDEVENVLKPIWRSKPSAARETRRHLQTVFGAAKARGHLDRNAINPATWEDNLKHLLPKQPKAGSLRGKHKALPYQDMPDFMVDLRNLTAQSAKMLEVCILTCVRTIEVVQMQWAQLDLKKGRWVIPGKVMKNTLEADVPLTDTVIALLREIQDAGWDDTYVFPGLKAGTTCSNNTMLKLLKVDMGRNATVHGFRSTFRTWGQNETAIEREVLEYCLHHIEGGAAELAYARGDVWEKRKAALKAWETFCNRKKGPKLKLVA